MYVQRQLSMIYCTAEVLLGNCVFLCLWFGPTVHSLCSSSAIVVYRCNSGCTLYCVRVTSHRISPAYLNFLSFCLLSLLVFLCRRAANSWCRQGIGRYELMCVQLLCWDWALFSLLLPALISAPRLSCSYCVSSIFFCLSSLRACSLG